MEEPKLFTERELQDAVSQGQEVAYVRGFQEGREHKKYGASWLKQKIHRKLDIMFPSKEYDKARYRWLKGHSMTTSHMSQMSHKELKQVYKTITEFIGDIE